MTRDRANIGLENSLFFAIILLLSLPLNVFSQNYKFRHLDKNEGLSQITVNTICQDSQGYIWFGTQDGLNRYNGYTFKYFKNDSKNTNSISHSWIWDVFEDSKQNLWVGTWSGLNKISPDRTKIKRYYSDAGESGVLRGDRPVSIQEDQEGRIWIGCWGGGLNMYCPENDSFICYSSAINTDAELPGDYIRHIYIDSQNVLWIGTWEGLWTADLSASRKLEFSFFELPKGPSPSLPRITYITEDLEQNLWIGTLGKGVYKIPFGEGVIKSYTTGPSSESLAGNDIKCLHIDMSGKIWMGTVSKGISILNPQTNKFSHIISDPDNPESIAGDNVNSIFRDKSGLIWVGTKGLSCFNPSQNRFNTFSNLYSDRDDIQRISSISALASDTFNRLWIGTDGAGVFYLKDASAKTDDLWLQDKLALLNKTNISSIVCDDKETTWIGTRGNGLIKVSHTEREIFNFVEHADNPNSAGLNFINGLVFIPPSSLWIASYSQGLICFDTKQKKYVKFYNQPGISTSFPANYLLRIFKDQMNKLWICTWGAGVICFDPEELEWEVYSNILDDPESLSDNIPHTICETNHDNHRKIWIGTRKGLSCLNLSDTTQKSFINYYPSDGLPGSVVNSIIEDFNGNLWLSTNSGLSMFNPDSLSFRNFEESDGLQGNEFNAGAGLRLDDGRLVFGGTNGMNIFYPDSIVESKFQADIVIYSFKVFNDEIPLDPARKKIKLDYKENFLSFEFSSLDFTQSAKNQYKYQMVGIDQDWVFADRRRFASYTDIDPGNYTFQVMGTNSDGVWSKNVCHLDIEITPPYWARWWFRSLIALALVSLIYMIVNNKFRKLREIERIRVNIANDLHDDIGSSLTRIAIHSQNIQSNKDKKKVKFSIDKIGELSRDIISTMSDIVWSIDARNDSLVDMLDRMRDFAYNNLSENEISVSFHQIGMDKQKKIDVLIRQNIFSIFKESINNIVKHADASMVEIQIENADKGFVMMISDNGKGFSSESIRLGNGLQNMRTRASRIHGYLDIQSSNGTKIQLKRKGI